MRPLRVLQIAPYGPEAWGYGGIPRVVAGLSRGLARRGHEVTVVATDACDRKRRQPLSAANRLRGPRFAPGADGVDVRLFANLSNRLAYDLQLFLPRGMRQFLRRQIGRFDVVHLHALRNLPTVWGAAAAARAGVPFVFTSNGTAPRIERRRRAKAVWDALFGRTPLELAAKLLAVSAAEERQLVGLGLAPERIARLPNPIELDELDPPPALGDFRRRYGLGGRPTVLFLGRISPRKRVDLVVRACARLPADVQLVIAGDPMGAGPALEAALAEVGRDGVLLIGGLAGRERFELLADADVVAYPGEDEIFGLVPFEALLSGTPVVVADDSGCGELVRETGGGLLVPPGEVEPLSSAIERVLDDSGQWRRAAAAAADAVRARFGADAVSERLEAIYRGLRPASDPGASA